MMDTPSERIKRTVNRLSASQSIAVLLTLLVVSSGAVVVVAAQADIPNDPDFDTFDYWEDFEDQTAENFTGTYSIVQDSYDETYSLLTTDTATLTKRVDWSNGTNGFYTRLKIPNTDSSNVGVIRLQNQTGLSQDTIQLDVQTGGEFASENIELRWTRDDGDAGGSIGTTQDFDPDVYSNIYVQLTDNRVELYVWEPGEQAPSDPQINGTFDNGMRDGEMVIASSNDVEWYLDEVGIGEMYERHSISGTVTDEENNEISGANIQAVNASGSVLKTVQTDSFGQYDMVVDNGTYDLTAYKVGYFNDTATVTVDGDDVTQDFTLRNKSTALIIDTVSFLQHGHEADYKIFFESKANNSTRLTREDVTDNASLVSNDTQVLTVDQYEHVITATSDTSVNNRTYVEAEWTDPDTNTTYSTTKNITVANRTVDNFDILPPWQRLYASLKGGTDENRGDRTLLILIIGTAAASAVAIFATSFAGVATLTAFMMAGWIIGMVSDGVAIATVFIALFIGLNVAGNVDYTVRR